MIILQPIAIIAQGEKAPGIFEYKIVFEKSGKEVFYIFTVDERTIEVCEPPLEFSRETAHDPYVPQLYRAILQFHKARDTRLAANSNSAASKP